MIPPEVHLLYRRPSDPGRCVFGMGNEFGERAGELVSLPVGKRFDARDERLMPTGAEYAPRIGEVAGDVLPFEPVQLVHGL